MATLTIAHTFFSPSLESLRIIFKNLLLCDQLDANVFVCVQGDARLAQEFFSANSADHLCLIYDDGVGLSRARNIIIESSSDDYIIFCDDDTIVLPNIASLIAALKEEPAAVARGRSLQACQVGTRPLRRYVRPLERFIPHLEALRSRSIELVWPADKLRRSRMLFDESFGSGSKYRNSEEFLLVRRLLVAGVPLVLSTVNVSLHTSALTQRKHDDSECYGKGVAFRRAGGGAAPLFVLYLASLLWNAKWGGVKLCFLGYMRSE